MSGNENALLIVESPSKAKTINQYLGKGFKVMSSYGHVRSLPSASGSVVPEENFKMHYEIIDRSKKHIDAIVKSAKEAEIVYLATDPDREGEAIAWHIAEILKAKKCKAKISRVVFNEINKKAVLNAVEHPREIDADLVDAQITRLAIDYLYGFTLSPVLWRKLPKSRSAGRVQSVALKLVCNREAEIETFKSQEYWIINGNFSSGKENFDSTLIYFAGKKIEKFSITNADEAESTVLELKKHQYSVLSVEKKEVKRHPMPPFNTSSLLQEASRKFGMSAKKTAMLAQKLYEGIDLGKESQGLITYMRTDSVAVSEEGIKGARDFIKKSYGDSFLSPSVRVYKTKTRNAQEAHEAIRPTDVTRTPESVAQYLSKDELKLYELIWKRMLASQMEGAVYDQVSSIASDPTSNYQFKATGSTLKFEGYLKLYIESSDEEDEDNPKIPNLSKGDKLSINKIVPSQHFTQPPPRYTEASLVKKMEELGIGRPSTYPGIISILQDRQYVKLEKKRFTPESLGRIVSAFLEQYFTQYVAFDFTANLEEKLDDISNGRDNTQRVLEEFWNPFKREAETVMQYKGQDIIRTIEDSLKEFIFGVNAETRKCPKCKDGTLELKGGKFGMFVGCSNYPQCDFTEKLSASAPDNNDEDENSMENNKAKENKNRLLGVDPESGNEIMLKYGPYGPYVEVTVDGKIKRASIPKTRNPEEIEIDTAVLLLSLPKLLGVAPGTKQEITIGYGKFGPYIKLGNKFISYKAATPLEDLELQDAIEYLREKNSLGS